MTKQHQCVTQYAETLLGEQNYKILCMDQSSCKEPFTEAELERVLPPRLLDLYYRIRQRKEIAAAGLDGLEDCPYCDFKYVIENPDEKLFRCQNEECQAITCRFCKKPVSRKNARQFSPLTNYKGPSPQIL